MTTESESFSEPVSGELPASTIGWSVNDYRAAIHRRVPPSHLIELALRQLESLDDPAVLIGSPFRSSAIAAALEMDGNDPSELPLFGIPFLVKDNIDVAGVETTCGCPSFAYVPTADAEVVARLRRAGAIPVGKTNLDQFATGLVGTRSPHGTARNPINPDLVPGGSSSGSAVAVARGLVPFALGTDTAGSGRVPAAMCGIVGLKPTVGRFPSRGMVPAVRRIDCPTIFAGSVADCRLVARVMEGFDPLDPFSKRPRRAKSAIRTVGVPKDISSLAELMDASALRAYENVLTDLGKIWTLVEIDIEPYLAAGQLLYGGALVAERTAALGDFLSTDPIGLDPTVAKIVRGGASFSAVDAYKNEYRILELKCQVEADWLVIDAIVLPTIPGVATLAEVAAEPVSANVRLGTFTTFVNLFDLATIAVPVPMGTDGLPFGVQFIGPAWTDEALADAAQEYLGEPCPSGVETDAVSGEGSDAARPDQTFKARLGETLIAVVGAHLQGMPLNHQLTGRGARLVAVTETAPSYQLFALDATVPPKPGLRKVVEGGCSIVVEVWALSIEDFGSFTNEIPPPLGIGSVELIDGSTCRGFICEPVGFDRATDISQFGGWRAYRAEQGTAQPVRQGEVLADEPTSTPTGEGSTSASARPTGTVQ